MSSDPNNILIVRLSAIGDIVMASGLIPSLQKRFPHAKISWLAEPVGASLLQHNPNLAEVVLWPRQQWQSLFRRKQYSALFKAVQQFRKMLKAKQYDLNIRIGSRFYLFIIAMRKIMTIVEAVL